MPELGTKVKQLIKKSNAKQKRKHKENRENHPENTQKSSDIPGVERKRQEPAVRDVQLVAWEEGPAAQVLHLGPYDAEAPTIARLHEYLAEQGLTFDGRRHKHHEIYLGDPRRAAPEKLRTIIRQSYAG